MLDSLAGDEELIAGGGQAGVRKGPRSTLLASTPSYLLMVSRQPSSC